MGRWRAWPLPDSPAPVTRFPCPRAAYETEYGGLQIHADILREARRLAPDAIHAINEGQILPGGDRRDPYEQVIRFLTEQGQAPDVVGFMGHFGSAKAAATIERQGSRIRIVIP